MKRKLLVILICTLMMCVCACGKDEVEIEYGEKEGVAEGSVDLSGDEPEISIPNIKSKQGVEIDFLSNVIVKNEEEYEDLEIWVNAAEVDIFEPGDYTAIYTFKYNGKSIEHKITVTILPSDTEASATDNNESATDNSSEQATTSATGEDVQDTTKPTQGSSEVQGTSKNETTTKNTTTATTSTNTLTTTTKNNTTTATKNNTTTTTTKNNVTTTTKNNTTTSTTKNNTTTTTKKPTSNTTTETTRKQLITTSGATLEPQNIGYSYIELLSGSVVSIKTTTAKYIVSTRTDISYTTKNNVKYKVSKLVIRYNTGEERTLETVEEKCK